MEEIIEVCAGCAAEAPCEVDDGMWTSPKDWGYFYPDDTTLTPDRRLMTSKLDDCVVPLCNTCEVAYTEDSSGRVETFRPTHITRRAVFVYEAARLAAIAAEAPIVPAPWDEREPAFRAQFLDVIERQMGPMRSTSPEELHGSWVQAYVDMGWTYGPVYDREAKTHPDMVPYAQLNERERDKDAVFVALCDIARQWIKE